MERRDAAFDFDTARDMGASFAAACGVTCRLFDADGSPLWESQPQSEGCAFCRKMSDLTGQTLHCDQIHLHGAYQAQRFGGRYIYLCPSGMAYFASPILVEGKLVGSYVAGPVLIMDIDDYLAGDTLSKRHISADLAQQFRPALASFPRRDPPVLSHLSTLLFAATVYVGDSSRAAFLTRQQEAQQQHISEHIQQLKLEQPTPYPLVKERELVRAITEGDQTTARRLLNELLGYILFSTGGHFPIMRARSLELMSVLSRAAIDGGADIEQTFDMSFRFLSDSDRLRSVEDLMLWLNQVIERFTASVFHLVDIQHKHVIYKALDYMKRSCMEKITLDSTAQQVGLSPSYFSKVFKDEMGTPFNHYLNELRISRAKALLLDGSATIVEICAQAGFDDQSYFTKVFKKHTGVTPAKFRERRGRLETEKERS